MEGGRFERNGLRDNAHRAILTVSEVLHLYAVGSVQLEDKAQEGIPECEDIGTLCSGMMMHRGDEGNEKHVLPLLSFRKSAFI